MYTLQSWRLEILDQTFSQTANLFEVPRILKLPTPFCTRFLPKLPSPTTDQRHQKLHLLSSHVSADAITLFIVRCVFLKPITNGPKWPNRWTPVFVLHPSFFFARQDKSDGSLVLTGSLYLAAHRNDTKKKSPEQEETVIYQVNSV